MNSDQQKLMELVSEYSAAVRSAVNLLNDKSEQTKGFQHQQTGYLDSSKKSEYAFHGFGCMVKTSNFIVDFDFGEGGRCDGIDPGFLLDFVNNNTNVKHRYSCFTSRKQIKILFQALEEDGIFVKDLSAFLKKTPELYNDTLYYLVSEIDSADAPYWRAYPPDDKKAYDETM